MKGNWKLALYGTAILSIGAALVVGWNKWDEQNPRLLPTTVTGVWTTDDTRYKGRFLELYEAFVIIGAGGQEVPQVQVINSVKPSPAGDEILYKIVASDLDGSAHEMTLLFNPARGGELHFKNQANVMWRRHLTDGAPKP
jgi:hypothetical protein